MDHSWTQAHLCHLVGQVTESLSLGPKRDSPEHCVARAKNLALDRVDVTFAAKELCRRVSSPI